MADIVRASMSFDFVVETPQKRGINRNNHRLIQKRATQAGAKSRSEKRTKSKCSTEINVRLTSLPIRRPSSNLPSEYALLANASIAQFHNSPFLARFGKHGQALYLLDPKANTISSCFRLSDPTVTVLQRQLLIQLASLPICSDANRLFKIMMLTQSNFLRHLPAHYGQLKFLDEAIECLVARLNEVLPLVKTSTIATSEQPSPTALYGKALTSLRTAIEDQLTESLSYIWFAIMLLILFELLSTGDDPGWIWHAAGSARMLYKVGPENIKSEFHMSLLSLQSRIMVLETIFNCKPCYLADPSWQAAIRRTILDCDDYSDRSETNTELWIIGARIPNVFQLAVDRVHGFSSINPITPRRVLDRLLEDLTTWGDERVEMLEATCRDISKDNNLRHQALTILLAYYALTMIVCRLRVATEPFGASCEERRALRACVATFQLRRDLMSCRWSARNAGSIYARVAVGTEDTAQLWTAEIQRAQPGCSIQTETFQKWCSLIGRAEDQASDFLPPQMVVP